MKQGKFGIRLAFYGILSFVLAFINQPLLCGFLLFFVLLKEEDRWTVRQVLQGFMLSLVVNFFSGVSYLVGSAVSMPFRILFDWYNYGFSDTVQSAFSFFVYAGALVVCIIAILRLSRDQEANVPLLSNLAYHILGEQKPPKPVKQPVWPQQPPMQPYPPQQPQQGQGQPMPPMQGQMPMQGYPMPPQPMQQPPQAPAPVLRPAYDPEQTLEFQLPPNQTPPPEQQPVEPEQQPPQQV